MYRLAGALLLAAGTAPARATSPDTSTVYDKIRDRLGLMQAVAAWKTKHNQPVEDLAREKIVVQSSIDKAKAAGIDGPSVRVFFEEQIAAAKEIQSCWMERWSRGSRETPQSVPDLVEEIRPRLIEIGAEILKNVALALKNNQVQPFDAEGEAAYMANVEVDCLSENSRRRIYRALGEVRLKN